MLAWIIDSRQLFLIHLYDVDDRSGGAESPVYCQVHCGFDVNQRAVVLQRELDGVSAVDVSAFIKCQKRSTIKKLVPFSDRHICDEFSKAGVVWIGIRKHILLGNPHFQYR